MHDGRPVIRFRLATTDARSLWAGEGKKGKGERERSERKGIKRPEVRAPTGSFYVCIIRKISHNSKKGECASFFCPGGFGNRVRNRSEGLKTKKYGARSRSIIIISRLDVRMVYILNYVHTHTSMPNSVDAGMQFRERISVFTIPPCRACRLFNKIFFFLISTTGKRIVF